MTLATWADLAIGAPLLVFVVMLLGLRSRPQAVVGLSLLAATTACVATWMLALQLPDGGFVTAAPWAVTEDFTFHFGFRLSGLSTAMACVVGTIHLGVQIYSVGYMAEDPHKARYFGTLSFFASVMLCLVLASDLVQTFVAWELVGLASYLLIGFWGYKPEAAQAAKKAFIMTRFGDIGLFVGLVLLLLAVGDLRIDTVLAAVEKGQLDTSTTTTVGLLLLCGIAGKSAQFPLFPWLPDAMAGPTPVSALLHSATMVAAGVYLFALLQPLFLASDTVQLVALCLASGTAFLAAGAAMVERDMKRVLAWSSVSQLSYMLMGLAAGSLVAGFFHLVTHAGFKCLLFLSAGIFIHHAHSNDLFAIGDKVGRTAKVAFFGLAVGTLSLSGAPGFAGFLSKEPVLTAVHHHAPLPVFGLALVTSAMTAYYAGRLLFAVAFRQGKGSHGGEAEHHSGAGDRPMNATVAVLGVAVLGIGWIGSPLAGHLGGPADEAAVHWASAGVGMALFAFVVGAGMAWRDFGPKSEGEAGFLGRLPAVARLLEQGWYLDAFWRWVSDRIVHGLTAAAVGFDRGAVDKSIDGVALQTRSIGGLLSRLQSGRLQTYVSVLLGLLGLTILALGWA